MTENKTPLIEVVDLHKSFGDLEVLKGINETIYKGEVISIIGASGGGKSTFLRCLNLLEVPTSGKVIFDDCPDKPNYKRASVHSLCKLGDDLRLMPDKKAIKKWVEGEVLLHSL